MNKRRLTFRRVFNNRTYRFDEPKIAVRFDSYANGEETNALIVEKEEDVVFENGMYITCMKNEHHYLVGEVANRLYEYEQLGYSPEELKEIIDDRKKLKERLNSLYGASVFDGNVESLYPRVLIQQVGRRHGKTLLQAEMARAYINNDIETVKALCNKYFGALRVNIQIKDVIFNDPATIIFWKDGTKTVVKAQEGETYDPEKGLAMAISKKALGNQHEYYDVFKKWLKKFKPSSRTLKLNTEHTSKWLAEQRLHNALNDKKATKADLMAAMQDAITYLNNKKEN